MALKPQDIVVLLKLAAHPARKVAYNQLALELGISVSEVHAAVKRSLLAGLATQNAAPRPIIGALLEFLRHGVRYAFPAELGGPVRGMPTAHAAPPLNSVLSPGREMPPVWPDAEGDTRGLALSPLYRSVPDAARRDPDLYALLTLVDVLRIGGARERKLAASELERRLAS